MFQALIDKFEKLAEINSNEVIHEVFEDPELQEKIVELNKQQLLEGKGKDFNDLPKYIDDPYFKTIKSAKAYESFKQNISPNHNKPSGVMDFYINGQFHSTIRMKNGSDNFSLISDSDIADDVQLKTGNEALGLADESFEIIRPEVLEKMRENLHNRL